MERLVPERSGEQWTKRDNLRLIPTLLLLMRMSIIKVAHISAAAIQGLGEVCLSSIYRSTLAKKIIHFSQMPSDCHQRHGASGHYKANLKMSSSKITATQNTLVTDLFKSDQRNKHFGIIFFFQSEEEIQYVKKMFMKSVWIKAKRLSKKKKKVYR